MNKYLNKIKWIISILIILFLTIYYQSFNFCNDYYFDIRSGKDLLKYGIDFKDHFSFVSDLKYYYHHFFYDIVLAFIHNIGGQVLTNIFFHMLLFSCLLILFIYSYKTFKNRFISLLVVFMTCYLDYVFFDTRVQSFSIIILLLEFIFLEKLSNSGKIKYIVILLLLSIVFVNTHMPLWPLYPVMFLPYIADILVGKIKCLNKFFIFEKYKSEKKVIITFILTLLTPFISIYGYLPYVFVFMGRNEIFYKSIMELKVNTFSLSPSSYAVMGIVLVLFIWNFVSKEFKIDFKYFCYLTGLSIFAVMAYRNSFYLKFFAPFIIIYIIDSNVNVRGLFIYIYNKFFKVFKNKIVYLYILLIPILIICIYSKTYALSDKFKDFGESSRFPKEISEYLINNTDYKNKHIFTEFNSGSYLAYKNIPIFVDSRAEVYMASYNGGVDVFGDYIKICNASDMDLMMKKYKFDYFIVSSDYLIYKYLLKNDNYKLVYNENNMYYLFETVNLIE